ncbi:zinc finger protein 511 [Protopterus annectens]|uniref:zinc finger protein 511 n=1 Tax=Protopterus annectens TaxID=7888 RepID=UPI001CF98645|nr:zinc finger protein 511 [Protopterus annectens]
MLLSPELLSLLTERHNTAVCLQTVKDIPAKQLTRDLMVKTGAVDGLEESNSAFTFASKRVFLKTTEDFFEDGDIHRHFYLQDSVSVAPEVEIPKVSDFGCHIAGCCQVFDTLESYEHHYNTLHRNVCAYCKRSFPTAHLLDIHIPEWHDSFFQVLAEKQNMYRCLVESCKEMFKTSKERKEHLMNIHTYPSNFRFDKPVKIKSPSKQDKHSKKLEAPAGMAMDVPLAAPEDSGVDSMEVCPSEPVDTAETSQPVKENISGISVKVKPKVPATICFGHGSVRGFKGARRK